jgi:carboxypeptidase T
MTLRVANRLLAFTCALIGALAAHAQTELPDGPGPWVVRASYQNDTALNRLLRRATPWSVDRRAQSLILDVPNRYEFQRLRDDGFEARVDHALTRAMFAPAATIPGQSSGIPGYPCYRTVTETLERLDGLARRHSEIVELIDIGDSWEKRNGASGDDLVVARLTRRDVPGPKPALFVMGALHAREYATAETLLRFAERIVAADGVDPDWTWILDHHEIHLLPIANPDGRRVAQTAALRPQRKNRNALHCAGGGVLRGVDLNRNFPFDWGGLGSSADECDPNFRGPDRVSEPELAAITSYLEKLFADQRNEQPIPAVDLTTPISLDAEGIFIDLHSPAAAVWWPWGNVDGVLAPNATQLQTLGRKLAFYNGYRPAQSNDGGAIAGASDDYVFGTRGVASFTIEMGGDGFFPDCKSYELEMLEPNLAALASAAKMVRAPYRLAAGPELISISAPSALQTGATIRIDATADDLRFNVLNGAEPSQLIAGASVYRTPPWLPNASAIANFGFRDGISDSPIEAMRVLIPHAALPRGRQRLYLQARDALGNLGPISAIEIDVGERAIFGDGFDAPPP